MKLTSVQSKKTAQNSESRGMYLLEPGKWLTIT